PLVVGRKNWLFSDTPAGAKASMNVYSMIETAKENELDPLKYLTFLLENRPNANMSEDELTKLAPWSEEAKKKCK
ncbi:MAG: transposase domain-containing protein, partial [Lachnospiraceae bacterium]|nr:transposase domain-containing protein [Lachnospiraceae bacterium]